MVLSLTCTTSAKFEFESSLHKTFFESKVVNNNLINVIPAKYD